MNPKFGNKGKFWTLEIKPDSENHLTMGYNKSKTSNKDLKDVLAKNNSLSTKIMIDKNIKLKNKIKSSKYHALKSTESRSLSKE